LVAVGVYFGFFLYRRSRIAAAGQNEQRCEENAERFHGNSPLKERRLKLAVPKAN
jgi:hypothetical protein